MKIITTLLCIAGLGLAIWFGTRESKDSLPLPPPVDVTQADDVVVKALEAIRKRIASDQGQAQDLLEYATVLHAHDLIDPAMTTYGLAAEELKDPFPALYLAGHMALSKDPKEALSYFTKAKAHRPNDHALLMAMARAESDLGHNEAAREHLIAANTVMQTAPSLLKLALVEEESQRYAEAKTLILGALRAAPRAKDVWIARARIEKKLGNTTSAKTAARYAEICTLNAQIEDEQLTRVAAAAVSFTPLVRLARSLQAGGLSKESISTWNRALALRPDDPGAKLGRASAYLDQGSPQRGIQDCQDVLEKLPDETGARFVLAECLHADGQRIPALHELNLVLAKEPRHAKALFRRAYIVARARPEKARADLALAIAEDPFLLPARLLLMRMAENDADGAEASRIADEILLVFPDQRDAKVLLSRIASGQPLKKR